MAAPIVGVTGAVPGATTVTPAIREAEGPDFASALGDAIESAGKAERTAEDMSVKLANGDPSVAIDQVMIASEKASISLRYAVALKNKAIEAYRELMNTPV